MRDEGPLEVLLDENNGLYRFRFFRRAVELGPEKGLRHHSYGAEIYLCGDGDEDLCIGMAIPMFRDATDNPDVIRKLAAEFLSDALASLVRDVTSPMLDAMRQLKVPAEMTHA